MLAPETAAYLMSVELFFTSLFAGYWFSRILYSTRYAVRRAGGYHVLLEAVIAGVVLLVIARGILWIVDGMSFAPFVGDESVVEKIFLKPGDSHYHHVLVLTVTLAFLLPHLMNFFPWVWERWTNKKQVEHLLDNLERSSLPKRCLYRIVYYFFCTKDSAVWMDVKLRGDATEIAFLRALHSEDLIELVMQDGSYIGFVVEREAAETGNRSDVGLIPLVRAYLSSETGKLHVRRYGILDESQNNRGPEDPVILFQMSSIRSVRYIRCKSESPKEDVKNYLKKLLEKPS